MIKVLVTGGSGQLGLCLQQVSSKYPSLDLVFLSSAELNILDKNALVDYFEVNKPAYVINCAAYTTVDLAEDNQEAAYQINCVGAANLAGLCKLHNATMLHVSTDFVFNGDTIKLLQEVDHTNPVNVYGQTKLDGERAIAVNLDHFFIVRTSWLYSEFGNNFVKTMLRLGKDKSALNVVADQIGTPTYAIDLAHVLLKIITSNNRSYGIYHYSNEGVTSWFDFASLIFSLAKMPVAVNPIPSKSYPTRAIRPPFSVMDKSKIKDTFNISIPHWVSSLELCLQKLRD